MDHGIFRPVFRIFLTSAFPGLVQPLIAARLARLHPPVVLAPRRARSMLSLFVRRLSHDLGGGVPFVTISSLPAEPARTRQPAQTVTSPPKNARSPSVTKKEEDEAPCFFGLQSSETKEATTQHAETKETRTPQIIASIPAILPADGCHTVPHTSQTRSWLNWNVRLYDSDFLFSVLEHTGHFIFIGCA